MSDVMTQLVALFRDAGQAHHRAFAATNGADADWPIWYAAFLVPRLAVILGRTYAAPEVALRLRQWDGEHARAMAPEGWPEYYARALLHWHGSDAPSSRKPVN